MFNGGLQQFSKEKYSTVECVFPFHCFTKANVATPIDASWIIAESGYVNSIDRCTKTLTLAMFFFISIRA